MKNLKNISLALLGLLVISCNNDEVVVPPVTNEEELITLEKFYINNCECVNIQFNKVKTIYICNVDLQKGQPSHKQGRVIVSIKLKDTFDEFEIYIEELYDLQKLIKYFKYNLKNIKYFVKLK